MADTPIAKEFTILGQIDVASYILPNVEYLLFASRPASRFETDPIPVKMTERTKEPLNHIQIGYAGVALHEANIYQSATHSSQSGIVEIFTLRQAADCRVASCGTWQSLIGHRTG